MKEEEEEKYEYEGGLVKYISFQLHSVDHFDEIML